MRRKRRIFYFFTHAIKFSKMNRDWANSIDGIRAGISLYFVSMMVASIASVVKFVKASFDVEDLIQFGYFKFTGVDWIITIATVVSIVALFLTRSGFRNFADAQGRAEDRKSVLDICSGYSWLISANVLSVFSFFLTLMVAILVLGIVIIAFISIRGGFDKLASSPVASNRLSQSYKSLRTTYGWSLAAYFLGPIGAIINLLVFLTQLFYWGEIENTPVASCGVKNSLRGVERLYNPDLVEACRRELGVREGSSKFQSTVKEYSDYRINEILTNPEIYSDELVRCCSVERLVRQQAKQEELAKEAMKAELKSQILKEIEEENKIRESKESKPLPQWFWWVLGGSVAVVIGLICFFVFREKPRYVTPDRDDYTYESRHNSSNNYNNNNDNNSYGYPGLYPQASTRLLTHEDLYGMSGWDLRVMRNEILARYGYIFKTAEMRNYFSSQPWYEPRYTEVNHMLTSLEWRNIKLIKQYE